MSRLRRAKPASQLSWSCLSSNWKHAQRFIHRIFQACLRYWNLIPRQAERISIPCWATRRSAAKIWLFFGYKFLWDCEWRWLQDGHRVNGDCQECDLLLSTFGSSLLPVSACFRVWCNLKWREQLEHWLEQFTCYRLDPYTMMADYLVTCMTSPMFTYEDGPVFTLMENELTSTAVLQRTKMAGGAGVSFSWGIY